MTYDVDDEPTMLKIDDVVDEKWVVIGLLGRGGFAEVYEVADDLDNRFALKLLRAHAAKDYRTGMRLVQEAMVLRELDNPNVVRLISSGRHEGQVYFVMELIVGKTLRRYLQLEGSMSLQKAVRVARAICSGLEAIHERGFVHRDIKPSNIFVLQNDGVKIVDLGIAKHSNIGFQTSRVLGTSGYMAPDYLTCPDAKKKIADPRWDVFAVGIVLWELIAGHHPLEGRVDRTAFGLFLTEMVKGDFPTLEETCACPKGISDVVMTAIAKDPEERFQTVAAFRNALKACLDDYLLKLQESANSPLPASYSLLKTEASNPPDRPRRLDIVVHNAQASEPVDPTAVTAPVVGSEGSRSAGLAAAGPHRAPAVAGPQGTVKMATEAAVEPSAFEAAVARREARLAQRQARLARATPTPPARTAPLERASLPKGHPQRSSAPAPSPLASTSEPPAPKAPVVAGSSTDAGWARDDSDPQWRRLAEWTAFDRLDVLILCGSAAMSAAASALFVALGWL